MQKRIPAEAFDFYAALGPGRSYEAVAQRFGVKKRAVVRRAVQEGWQGRLSALDAKQAKEEVKRIRSTRGDLKERQQKLLRAIEGRAVEALKAAPINNAMDAVRALAVTLREQREILDFAEGEIEEEPVVSPKEARPEWMLQRWWDEAPQWHFSLFGAVLHWGASNGIGDSQLRIAELLMRLCDWLDCLFAKTALEPKRPFHEILLEGFAVEGNAVSRAAMKVRLFELARLFEEERVRKGRAKTGFGWQAYGLKRTGDPAWADGQEWREVYRLGPENDPVSYAARRLSELEALKGSLADPTGD